MKLAFAPVALAALLLGLTTSASAVAPGTPRSIVFAEGDALDRGSILELADANGTGAAVALTKRSLDAAMPAVSPDGSRVAFASLAPKGGIFVLRVASHALTRLTARSGDITPTWSPDGTQIAFARRLAKGGHELMAIAPTGGTATAIPGARGWRPDFAPDGTRIVFQRDGASGLAVVGAHGGTPKSLGPGASPSWSPDGQLIAFSAPVERMGHLFLVAPDGSGRRDITRFAPISEPSWSPDGSRIVVVTTTGAGTCCGLATVDASGNGRVRITHGLAFASRPAWVPAPR